MSAREDVERLLELHDAHEAVVSLEYKEKQTLEDFVETKNIEKPEKPDRSSRSPDLIVHKKEEFYLPKEIKKNKKYLLPLLIGCFVFVSAGISVFFPLLIAFISNPENVAGTVFFILAVAVMAASAVLTVVGFSKKRKADSVYEKAVNEEKEREQKALEEMSLANAAEKKKYEEEIKIQEDAFQTEFEEYRIKLREYESRKTLFVEEYEKQKKQYAIELLLAIKNYEDLKAKYFPDVDIDIYSVGGTIDILNRGFADNAKEAQRIYKKKEEQCSSCIKRSNCKYNESNLGDCPAFIPVTD
ncbi:MAG: hypothetical protein MJ239_07470 [Bacilli bacterium]|nr:hypothetical protein [Bacilli bacterium]